METGNAAPTHVTQAEFARLRSVSRKTVTLWKQKGWLIIDDAGRVDVAATERLLSQRPANYRGGAIAAAPNQSPRRDPIAAEPSDEPDAPPPEPTTPVYDASGNLIPSLAQSQRAKEYYLGELRRHELEVKSNEWVRIEAVGAQIEREYAVVREQLLAIPGKVAFGLVGADRATIESTIRAALTEALHELHDPAGFAERAVSAE